MSVRVRVVQRTVNEEERLIATMDPRRVLSRGYGLVYDEQGVLVRGTEQVAIGSRLKITLTNGTLETEVKGKQIDNE